MTIFARRAAGAVAVVAAAATAVGSAAVTPTAHAASNARQSAVTAHSTDPAAAPTNEQWGDAVADAKSKDAQGRNQANLDPGSLYTVETALGVRAIWGGNNPLRQSVTGNGVGVAVLDSGVDQVPGLAGSGKVIYGPDLSIEGNGVLADHDTYGHGTFMAGIVAGRGTSDPTSKLAGEGANVQLGIAPDAQLLAMKLATTDGSTDVTQVIAAIDWVIEHPTLPNGTPIRVINLSYGTDSAQSYQVDPLAAAVENAWKHGIVVVTSVGNEGASTGRLTDPAIDPYVLSVAALDNSDQPSGWNNPTAASFSNVGNATRSPDLGAPGRSIVSLRAPGSYVDTNYPSGRVAGDPTGTLFRGSGTSQAAAVVSGVVALLLQAYPTLTPDQVKAALVRSALPMPGIAATAVGAGRIDPGKAMTAASQMVGRTSTATRLRAAAEQHFIPSNGLGSIEAARGGALLVDPDGNDVSGEIDVQGASWNGLQWMIASRTLTAWSGGRWLGETFTGSGWDLSGGTPSARWFTARWSSARWSDADWTSARWSAAQWSSARWSSARWSSARWSSRDW
jgi:serine protease AprX